MTEQVYLPVCHPQLPPAEAIAAYIRQMDDRRQYTNRGPLVTALEGRLARLFDRPGHAVRLASTGTSALEVAILATTGLAGPDRPLALLPSFTFAATALAVERCGYRPWFVAVDPETWALDPIALARHPMIGEAGLIVPVAAYGRLPDMAGYEALMAATGVQVILDAAAAFEALLDRPGEISATVPTMVSLHATKTFSTGEGGAVLWDDAAGQERVVQVANFGFWRSRECKVAGTNAKLSEYHAAVGLAMLDGWDDRRRAYATATRSWRDQAAGRRLGGQLHMPPDVSSAYVLLEVPDGAAFARTEAALHAAFIETRAWYQSGLHAQPHFAGAGRDPLPVTEDLSARLIGLPAAHDIAPRDIAKVLGALEAVIA